MGPEPSSQQSFFSRTREKLLRAILMRATTSSQSELAKVIEQASLDEIINEDTEDMIRGVFDVAQRRVSDIMMPRSEIVAIDIESSVGEAIKIVTEHGHSRYPVYSESKDHIQGILMAKDLLPLATETDKLLKDFNDLLRKPEIVPETKRVDMMLKDFQKNRFHMAIVIDEHGGVCGLVTIEDIIELIVGEINDEYETEDEPACITKTAENSYIIDAATTLEEFEEYFKTKVPEVDVDTIGGLVIHSLGHIPQQDEETTINEFTFKVLEVEAHKVIKLSLTVAPHEEEQLKANT